MIKNLERELLLKNKAFMNLDQCHYDCPSKTRREYMDWIHLAQDGGEN
jgi:hypothetical protein